MAKHSKQPAATPSPERPALAILVALGALAAMWAVFQWGELLVSRSGGETFCTVNSTFDCRAVWDSSLASLIHGWSGVPVAGWGVIWGVVALVLPLWCLHEPDGQNGGPAWTATLVAAASGLVSVAIFAFSSMQEGFWCLTCIVTYVVVGGYGLVAYYQWRKVGAVIERRGIGLTAAATMVVYLVLLYPGVRTPKTPAKAEMAALVSAHAEANPYPGTATPAPVEKRTPVDEQLKRFISGLSPQMQQNLSAALEHHRRAPALPLRSPRQLLGSPDARLRITEFTDALCGHCANLHHTLNELRRLLPPDAFALEMRQFPLDPACNPALAGPSQFPIRCFAAKAQICFESTGHAYELAGKIFQNGRRLTEDFIYELAAPFMSRQELRACMEAPETQQKLADDIAWATAHHIAGTPLVLLNGQEGSHFGPFLYAMALTQNRVDHPAFAKLPKARSRHAHD